MVLAIVIRMEIHSQCTILPRSWNGRERFKLAKKDWHVRRTYILLCPAGLTDCQTRESEMLFYNVTMHELLSLYNFPSLSWFYMRRSRCSFNFLIAVYDKNDILSDASEKVVFQRS